MKIITSLIFFLWSWSLSGQDYPVVPLLEQGEQQIKLVFLGDGYTVSQQNVFIEHARSMLNALLLTSPFKEYRAYFNAYAIQVPSAQSGADHPGTGTDVSEPAFPVSDVNTIFNTTFDYFNIHRLVVPQNSGELFNILGRQMPDFDQAFVVVNSKEYGGSGGFFATSTVNESANEIAIHEIGHSFAGLSDEYYAGDQFAGESPNMTQERSPAKVRWQSWLNQQGVGIFQHCCGGLSSQWYKPHQNCKMQVLGPPFCLVCRERLVDRIYELVNPIHHFSPEFPVVPWTESTFFTISTIKPNPNTTSIQWYINGKLLKSNTDTLYLKSTDLTETDNLLEAIYVDSTTLSRTYLPSTGYSYKVSWTVTDSGTTAVIQNPRIIGIKAKLRPTLVDNRLTVLLTPPVELHKMPWQISTVTGEVLRTGVLIISGAPEFAFEVGDLSPGLYYFTLNLNPFPMTMVFIKQ